MEKSCVVGMPSKGLRSAADRRASEQEAVKDDVGHALQAVPSDFEAGKRIIAGVPADPKGACSCRLDTLASKPLLYHDFRAYVRTILVSSVLQPTRNNTFEFFHKD